MELGKRSRAQGASAPAQAIRPSVLIVDDDEALLRMVSMSFQFQGYSVSTATNGSLALATLEEADPDLIVLDLQMPVMDGRTFFRELRERGSIVPVVILSAYGAKQAHDELGTEGWLEKPFDPEELVATAASFLPEDLQADVSVADEPE